MGDLPGSYMHTNNNLLKNIVLASIVPKYNDPIIIRR